MQVFLPDFLANIHDLGLVSGQKSNRIGLKGTFMPKSKSYKKPHVKNMINKSNLGELKVHSSKTFRN